MPRTRGRPVLVVGGTGLYVRALLHGLTDTPPEPGVRRVLEEEARRLGPAAMHRRLAEIDPDTAARLAVADVLRVVRALEIHATTGTPPSQLRAAHGFGPARYRARLWFLDPGRETLEARIAERTRRMFERGLVAETEALVARGFRDTRADAERGLPPGPAVVDGQLTPEQAERADGPRDPPLRQATTDLVPPRAGHPLRRAALRRGVGGRRGPNPGRAPVALRRVVSRRARDYRRWN